MTPPAEKLRIFQRFLNLAENDSGSPETDYKTIYIYRDGNNKRRQVTLARGFTDDGGNLKKVVERYLAKGGKLAATFEPRLPKFGRGLLVDDKEFIASLVKAGEEQVMKEAQDEIFNEVYLGPAMRWAETFGFKEMLSIGAIIDSFLHSGTVPEWLCRKFNEKRPSAGGNERKWMAAYLPERLAWFERATGALHTCTFRPRFFLAEIAKENWGLACPLAVPGKGRIC